MSGQLSGTTDIRTLIAEMPQGMTAGELVLALARAGVPISRSTLNRQLRAQIAGGFIIAQGEGPARRYFDADPLRALRQYFDTPYSNRTLVLFQENRLNYAPVFTDSADADIGAILAQKGTFVPLDKRTLAQFLIDFSCSSSFLEGSTYSALDTQALIEYGEMAEGKPFGDAVLILNHKNAFEYLYDHPVLESIFEIHARLTDDHNMEKLRDSPHFLPQVRQGIPRDDRGQDIVIAQSAYHPPSRPGTGYIRQMLAQILDTAKQIENPVEAAFYLFTRLPYLQPFQDGNKRTSRALCNVPLLQAGLPPLSFVDVKKRDYIVGLLAFYELGDTRLAKAVFGEGYLKSASRFVPRV